MSSCLEKKIHPSLLNTDKGTISSLLPSALGSTVRRAGDRLFVSCPPDVACPQRGRPPSSLCLSALTVTYYYFHPFFPLPVLSGRSYYWTLGGTDRLTEILEKNLNKLYKIQKKGADLQLQSIWFGAGALLSLPNEANDVRKKRREGERNK